MNAEVSRQPYDPATIMQDIDDVFVFNAPLTSDSARACDEIQTACKNLAKLVVDHVPEGKEQTIAINNILSAALFARHGMTRRQVFTGVVVQTNDTQP